MRRLKTIIPIAGILLLILSAASMYVALQNLSELRSAEDYEDRGIFTFQPYDVLPVQVKNTGASSRDRRMNPTKTVYMVYYRATDGIGYKWSDEAISRDAGQKIVDAGKTVERRVLSIPEDGTYITVEPEQTAESYTESLRGKYTQIVGFSFIYIVFFIILLILTKLIRLLRKNRTRNEEVERFNSPVGPTQFGPEIAEPRPRRRWRWAALLAPVPVVLLLFVFWSIGHRASDPVTLDYNRTDTVWSCQELSLRFTLPIDGEYHDVEELQKQREQALGRSKSAGQVVLAAADNSEGSTMSLTVVRRDRPTDASVLEAVQAFANQVARDGTYQLSGQEDLTVAGQQWMTWRIETPERNLVHYYLCRQSGAYWLIMVSYCPLISTPPAILTCFDGENTVSVTPANAYLPAVNEEGYCILDVPPSLMGNKTQEELLEEWQKDLKNASPEDMVRAAWTELRANEDGSVSYIFTPEQYQRMKRAYYCQGTRIWPEMFGINPGDIIKRISYEKIDRDGIPWGVGVWIDQTAYVGAGSFSNFVSQFVPMTMIGRYQLMCGVPTQEWTLHVVLRDAETNEVLAEGDFPMEE